MLHFYTVWTVTFDPLRDYPLGTKRPDRVRTPGGLTLDELTLHGRGVESAELRATPETLRLQAEVAQAAGRAELAANFRRAAELAQLPDETILAVYTALRPGTVECGGTGGLGSQAGRVAGPADRRVRA